VLIPLTFTVHNVRDHFTTKSKPFFQTLKTLACAFEPLCQWHLRGRQIISSSLHSTRHWMSFRTLQSGLMSGCGSQWGRTEFRKRTQKKLRKRDWKRIWSVRWENIIIATCLISDLGTSPSLSLQLCLIKTPLKWNSADTTRKREVEKRVKSQQINFFQLGVCRLFAAVFQSPFGHFLSVGLLRCSFQTL